ncbi:probable pectinesterase 68 isoform X1 [Zingiber officinale]|uniref:probable pectinesterase 68 isoform X1 n=1 Tax=Zingiber officinale TaxID=94328 RepID=UPI001C4C2724|nr:probable pectinesterase 68 isoform X1 [Zingiber officinale]
MEALGMVFLYLGLTMSGLVQGSTYNGDRVSYEACEANATRPHGHRNWFKPTSQQTIVVDADGSGDFLSVQEAVDSVPENNTKRVVIHIHAGCYIEKVTVPATKPYITFHGAGRDVTVIEWHDRASDRGPNGQQLRTYNTASVTVFASYFRARNISFKVIDSLIFITYIDGFSLRITIRSDGAEKTLAPQNTAPAPMPGMEGWQAAAFRISGDKAYFFGCGFYGAQDTLCDDAGRHYFKDCYIEGSIDFIFGNGRSMYKNCQIHSVANRFGSIAAQDRNSPCERTGFAFVNCQVTGTGKLYVGRAMGRYSRIVFAYTYFDDVVVPGGWDDWDDNSNKNKTAFFGVYRCFGPGSAAVRGVSWARELDYEMARPFIAQSFVNGRHWLEPSDP